MSFLVNIERHSNEASVVGVASLRNLAVYNTPFVFHKVILCPGPASSTPSMVCTMAFHSFLRLLCALSLLLSGALSHMQMSDPSPLRDPHADRENEPKDYNILTPLRSDGSDFTCKGYQWNTLLTSVASYTAGQTYELKLKGSATHGGGSCQISLSCDNGVNFKVLRSIVGGCPQQDSYDFTIPENCETATCLLAWTWYIPVPFVANC